MSTEILFVCGDQQVLQKGRQQLEHEGYYVTSIASFDEASDLCREQFDMVVIGQSLSAEDMRRFIREVHSVCLSPILALRQPEEAPVKEADYNITMSDSLNLGKMVGKLLVQAKAA
jgi:DNA-binding response OmpR family regulator